MDAVAILDALTFDEGLPREALRAAGERRGELVAPLIAAIEAAIAAVPDERERPSPLFFAIFLLAEWRETAACRPILRLLRLPSDHLDAVLGDALTEDGHRVVAAVFDGDAAPLLDAIRDPRADQFARACLLEALTTLVAQGRLPRADAVEFLRDSFATLEPKDDNFVWMGWIDAVATLGAVELTPLVRAAFDRGSIDPMWTDFAGFERDVAAPALRRDPAGRRQKPWVDTIAELSTWHAFTDAGVRARARARRVEARRADDRLPRINPFRGVGRNDPCPCGSGKKFKRCCGG